MSADKMFRTSFEFLFFSFFFKFVYRGSNAIVVIQDVVLGQIPEDTAELNGGPEAVKQPGGGGGQETAAKPNGEHAEPAEPEKSPDNETIALSSGVLNGTFADSSS
jgi:hypothetical protein